MPMGMENPLLLLSEDFEFYCLQLESPVKNFNVFLVGMRVQCSLPMGMKFQGIFLTGGKFLTDFSSGEVVPPGL